MVFVVVGFAVAAPMPKKLKKYNGGLETLDGVWKLVGYNNNNAKAELLHGTYWEVQGEKFWYSMKTIDNTTGHPATFTTPDPDAPQCKKYANSTCFIHVDGDELIWCFSGRNHIVLSDAEPGPDRHVYTFKRCEK